VRRRFRLEANVKMRAVTMLPSIPDRLSMMPTKSVSELFTGEIS